MTARQRALSGRRSAVAVAALAGATMGVSATAADAAELTVTGRCFASGDLVPVTGAGFTPHARVRITGDATATVTADRSGRIRADVVAPRNDRVRARMVTITARDSRNPRNAAPPLRFPVVHDLLWGNYDTAISGRPEARTTWVFSGFAPGMAIYGHFVLGGRVRASHRFGVARGACGTLTARAPRVPVPEAPAGRWVLQMDQVRGYLATTQPRRRMTFVVTRTVP